MQAETVKGMTLVKETRGAWIDGKAGEIYKTS